MSVKDVSDSEGEEDVWDEDWGEVEGEECVSLFSDFVVLPSVQACCEYDARHHEFDLREYIRTVRRLAARAHTSDGACASGDSKVGAPSCMLPGSRASAPCTQTCR